MEFTVNGNDDFIPKSGESEYAEEHIEKELNAPDKELPTMKKTARDFHQWVQQFKNKPISNGYVYCLLADFKNSVQKTALELQCIGKESNVNMNSLRTAIVRIFKAIKVLIKNVNENWFQIELFLAEDFKFPKFRPKRPSSISTTTVDSAPPVAVNAGDTSLDHAEPPLTPRINKRCPGCAIKKKSYIELRRTNKRLKLAWSMQKREKVMIKKQYEVSDLNHKLKRKEDRINKYRKKVKKLQNENKSLDKSLTTCKTNYRSLHKAVRKLQRAKLRMETKISDLQAQLNAKDSNIKKGNRLINEKEILIENLIVEKSELELELKEVSPDIGAKGN